MLSTPAPADASGCTLLLCTSPGAPPWQSVPECAQPVMTAHWIADHRMGWPQCPEAAGSLSANRNSGLQRRGVADEAMIC
jgi:hypothetical protein